VGGQGAGLFCGACADGPRKWVAAAEVGNQGAGEGVQEDLARPAVAPGGVLRGVFQAGCGVGQQGVGLGAKKTAAYGLGGAAINFLAPKGGVLAASGHGSFRTVLETAASGGECDPERLKVHFLYLPYLAWQAGKIM